MVFALVHFTVGFVAVFIVLSVVPITRYRLTGAYAGGVWALSPDIHHLVDGVLSERLFELHGSQAADLFFFHYTLDGAAYRAHNIELTFVSLAALGLVFLIHDWRVGEDRHAVGILDTTDDVDEASKSD